MTLAVVMIAALAGMLWRITGLSPLILLARLAMHGEAVRIQTIRCTVRAAAQFRLEYAETADLVKSRAVGATRCAVVGLDLGDLEEEARNA